MAGLLDDPRDGPIAEPRRATDPALEDALVDLRLGTYADALWNSLASNRAHGMRRTQADIDQAVDAALAHPRAREQSNYEIARHLGVGEATIRRHRAKLEAQAAAQREALSSAPPKIAEPPPDTRLVKRTVNGQAQSYPMHVAAVGTTPPASAPTAFPARSFTELLQAAGADMDPAIRRARLAESLSWPRFSPKTPGFDLGRAGVGARGRHPRPADVPGAVGRG